MPRLAVIIAGLCILAAGLYGGLRGFEFTDLDKGVAAPALADTVVRPGATEPAPTVAPAGLDERAVRELARAEVRQVIPPPSRPRVERAAPSVDPAAEPPAESPSTAVEPEAQPEPLG